MKELLFEDLILFDLEAEDKYEVIEKLSSNALKHGFVNENYSKDVIAREDLYPTALPTYAMKVAIPHALETDNVNKAAVSIAKLKEPVTFVQMGSDDIEVSVDIVFLLIIKGTKNQMEILQKLITMFSDQRIMEDMSLIESKEELVSFILKNTENSLSDIQ